MFTYNQLMLNSVPYDEDNPQHELELLKLWNKLYPNTKPPKGLKDSSWKAYGFQVSLFV